MIETYIPLYRKYRPQSFGDVMGQQAIVQTLSNALNQGKVAHAYLFCGPRGTGKTSTARIFAKSLNCKEGPTTTPCQVCPSCTGVTDGNALDVIEFDAASNNKVDDARELIENCQFSAMAGKYKIYIIDEVHMLTSQAFNALLKTLEEPPPNVVFIFATTEAHKVLPTIVSRCQRFDFTRITRQDIVSRLGHIADKESIQIDADALQTIARHVRGGMRDAVGLLDQVAVLGRAQPGKVISRDDVTLFIGALEEDVLVWLSQAIAERQADIVLQQINELERRGIEPPQLIKELTHHFRNLFLVASAQSGGRTEGLFDQLDLPESYFQKLLAQAPAYALEEFPQILSRLSAIERNVRHTQNPQLWLEVGILELAHRKEIHVIQNLSERIESLERALKSSTQAPDFQKNPQNFQPGSSAQHQPSYATAQQHNNIPAASIHQPAIAHTTPMNEPAQPIQTPGTNHLTPTQSAPPLANATPTGQDNPIPNQTGGDLQTVYRQICQQVASPTTKDLLLQQTFALSNRHGQFIIGCVSEPILEIVKNPKKFIHLQKAVEKTLGQDIHIQLVLDKTGPDKTSDQSNLEKTGGGQSSSIPKPSRDDAPTSASHDNQIAPPVVISVNEATPKPHLFSEESEEKESASTTFAPWTPISGDEKPHTNDTTILINDPEVHLKPQDIAGQDIPQMQDDLLPDFMMQEEENGQDLKIATAAKNAQDRQAFPQEAQPDLTPNPSLIPNGDEITPQSREAYELQEAKTYTLQLLQGRLM